MATQQNGKVFEAEGLLREAQRKINILEQVISETAEGSKATGAAPEEEAGGRGPPIPSQLCELSLAGTGTFVAATAGRGEMIRIKAGGDRGPELIALSPSTLKAHLRLVLAAAKHEEAGFGSEGVAAAAADGMDETATGRVQERHDGQRHQASEDSSLLAKTKRSQLTLSAAADDAAFFLPPFTSPSSSATAAAAPSAAATFSAAAPAFRFGSRGAAGVAGDDNVGAGSGHVHSPAVRSPTAVAAAVPAPPFGFAAAAVVVGDAADGAGNGRGSTPVRPAAGRSLRGNQSAARGGGTIGGGGMEIGIEKDGGRGWGACVASGETRQPSSLRPGAGTGVVPEVRALCVHE